MSRQAVQGLVIAAIELVLIALSIAFLVVSACCKADSSATWWMALSAQCSAGGFALLVANRIAKAVLQTNHQSEVLDDVVAEIREAAEVLMECGRTRLRMAGGEGDKGAFVGATGAASKLTTRIRLLLKCTAKYELVEDLRPSIRLLKQCFTDDVVDVESMKTAEFTFSQICVKLLEIRLSQ